MEKGPILILIFITSILIILYIFINKDTDYKEYEIIDKYTIYIKEKDQTYQELIFVDDTNEYYIKNNEYIFKSRFRTIGLKDAILYEIISIQDAMAMFPEITLKPANYIEVGTSETYTVYQSEKLNPVCKTNFEYFFLDEDYEYYFNCQISKYYMIRNNDNDYTLTEALEKKIVKIEDLQDIIPTINYKNISYQTLKKTEKLEIVQASYTYKTEDEIEILFIEDGNLYFFPTKKSKFYKIKQGNDYMSLQDALSQKIITIDELKLLIPDIYER